MLYSRTPELQRAFHHIPVDVILIESSIRDEVMNHICDGIDGCENLLRNLLTVEVQLIDGPTSILDPHDCFMGTIGGHIQLDPGADLGDVVGSRRLGPGRQRRDIPSQSAHSSSQSILFVGAGNSAWGERWVARHV